MTYVQHRVHQNVKSRDLENYVECSKLHDPSQVNSQDALKHLQVCGSHRNRYPQCTMLPSLY